MKTILRLAPSRVHLDKQIQHALQFLISFPELKCGASGSGTYEYISVLKYLNLQEMSLLSLPQKECRFA